MQPRRATAKPAFTIVELLIVIVVIGILATIGIVAFNGVRSRAVIATLQSDLTQNQKILQIYAVQNSDKYPPSQGDATANGVKSSTNTLSYRWIGGNNYCLAASNASQSTQYYVTNTTVKPSIGSCPAVVNTFVGNLTTSGYADGTATAARFSGAFGLAFDTSGNLFISDISSNRIRRATPSGVVTTIAGSGVQGTANGAASIAQFNGAAGIVFDSSGNLYIADQNNNMIRKLTAGGIVSTFAGTGIAGYADGPGSSAQFNKPRDVAIDSSGNLFVTDSSNLRIRKITPSGDVSTFAGSGVAGSLDGTGVGARIVPSELAIDSSNNLYVTCPTGNIRKITPAGVVTTIISGGDVQGPEGIEVDASGNIYVSDIFSLLIYKVSPTGVLTRLAGNGDQAFVNGLTGSTSFSGPTSIAIDQAGVLYVADGIYVAALLQ